jgi:hypothetical protein
MPVNWSPSGSEAARPATIAAVVAALGLVCTALTCTALTASTRNADPRTHDRPASTVTTVAVLSGGTASEAPRPVAGTGVRPTHGRHAQALVWSRPVQYQSPPPLPHRRKAVR